MKEENLYKSFPLKSTTLINPSNILFCSCVCGVITTKISYTGNILHNKSFSYKFNL